MKLMLLHLVLLFSFSTAFSQNLNITTVGTLPYSQDLNDIWGYVDETGIEYALVGTRTGTSIVSLANPSTPTEILFIPGDNSVWRDLKTWGDIAYVTADQGNDGLLIIDLGPLPAGTPSYYFWRPELSFNSDTDTLEQAHNLYIDENGICYIAGSNISAGENFLLDVATTPGTPIFLGATEPYYAHDAYARGDTLWTSDINDGVFSAYDVSNPANPVLLARQTTPRDFCHNAWISDDGQTLFTTDEKSNAWIGSFDVSDLSNIQELDRWRTATENTIPHNTHVLNDFLVTSYYTEGVIVLDGSRPDNLIEVARYDTYFGSPSTGFYGAWGAYPYLPSGLLLISDINTGLHVLQPNYQRAAWLEGLVTDSLSGTPLFGVDVEIINTGINESTDLSGVYKTGMGMNGSYQVLFKKANYIPKTIQVNLVNGQVTTVNVALNTAVPFQLTGRVVESSNPSVGIPNAQVVLNSSLYTYTATANANGDFSLQVLNEEYDVIAGDWGYVTSLVTVNALNSSTVGTVTVQLDKGYRDEFVLDLGWIETGDATTGNWERVIPENVYSWNGPVIPETGDIGGDIGAYCLITGNNGNGQNGVDDVDNGSTIAISPIMDLTGYSYPQLSFYYYLHKPFPFNSEDSLAFYISNGPDTSLVWSTLDAEYDWSSLQVVNIADYITLSNNMRIWIKVNDSSPGNIVESGIDFVSVADSGTTLPFTILPTDRNFLTAYPIPTQKTVRLDYQMNADEYLIISSLSGQIVEYISVPRGKGFVDIELPHAGMYVARLGNKTVRIIRSE